MINLLFQYWYLVLINGYIVVSKLFVVKAKNQVPNKVFITVFIFIICWFSSKTAILQVKGQFRTLSLVLFSDTFVCLFIS